ncbi:hypothetical protein A3E66_02750 [Candidatus Daviesbacteria bacterium RIFCSPHIGHO2_12_FULL_37_16]|uniref:General secretion pathway GspH domain-containing protein n=1 Tax=Candidatus Daviesbacteria bacterium RIFCSPHIGHO2_12_FULL_37_16 TaxID=1797778 RepID=A0A1F5K3D0_9BACT|nr:MAG: hypothetical protein A3E66_02750 [Candidatus Daviesbacteria bacterium RIFCSPHIGHO2_12_FULL_37_16]
MKNQGFTLIELTLVMGIIAILISFITINLLKPQTTASTASTVQILGADIKEQQIKAMSGDSDGESSTDSQGIYFESNRYTLFRGPNYTSGSHYFQVDMDQNLILSNTIPSSQVVFMKRSGEVANYTSGSDTITLSHTQSGEQKVITINRYGSITVN